MCGIAGIVGRSVNETHLGPMVAAMARRGPDDHGMWFDPHGGAGLGHTRLSIIDLSAAGHQPMTHGEGRFWITFNGEIYNYQELRSVLASEGYAFVTQTDTEVVLAGWAHWGSDALSRLRGMFAFAIWDREKQQLALCRDRMGIKPLLWAETAGGLVFASSLKALIASGLVAPVLEPRGVFDLFASGSVCQPRTMMRGVSSLEPGTCLVCGPGTGRKTIRYWDMNDAVARLQPQLSKLSYDDSVRLVRNLLEESCRCHLVADVPVGSFLSGGVDSTAITAIMAQQTAVPVKSFSVGFEESAELKNELDDARLAASHIGTDHTEVIVTGRDAEAAFDDLVYTIDQPSYDGANTYFVSRAAGAAVKVAVSGLGGDELFAGYGHFLLLQGAAGRGPRGLDNFVEMLHRLRPNRVTAAAAETSALRRLTMAQRYAQLRRGLTDSEIHGAMTDSLLEHFSPGFMESHVEPFLSRSQNPVTQTSLIECRQYLLNTLLRDADAMSMGHGLEVRPALLDHRLAEHALALPSHYKLAGGRQKAVFKDAVADILPPALLARPKTGFTLPMGRWLRNELRPRLLAVLKGTTARSLFKSAFLDHCLKSIDLPQSARTLWTLLIVVSWMDAFKVRLEK